jgi:hypothetical protein
MKVVVMGVESAGIRAPRLLRGGNPHVVAFAAEVGATTATVAYATRKAELEVRPPNEVSTAALGERLRAVTASRRASRRGPWSGEWGEWGEWDGACS